MARVLILQELGNVAGAILEHNALTNVFQSWFCGTPVLGKLHFEGGFLAKICLGTWHIIAPTPGDS